MYLQIPWFNFQNYCTDIYLQRYSNKNLLQPVKHKYYQLVKSITTENKKN